MIKMNPNGYSVNVEPCEDRTPSVGSTAPCSPPPPAPPPPPPPGSGAAPPAPAACCTPPSLSPPTTSSLGGSQLSGVSGGSGEVNGTEKYGTCRRQCTANESYTHFHPRLTLYTFT